MKQLLIYDFNNFSANIDESDDYKNYRNHTGLIFDNMYNYVGKSYKVVWSDICTLSDSYFNNQGI